MTIKDLREPPVLVDTLDKGEPPVLTDKVDMTMDCIEDGKDTTIDTALPESPDERFDELIEMDGQINTADSDYDNMAEGDKEDYRMKRHALYLEMQEDGLL